jgi:capsular exopolysaccharide synthesis family protein
MDSPPRQPPGQPADNNAKPAGYAGYGAYDSYGYGADYGKTLALHNFQQYLLILRERAWYILVIFLVVFSSVLVYTLSVKKIYESKASVQIFRRDPVVMQVQDVVENEVRSAEDLNTQVKILESEIILHNVAARITGSNLERLLAPYRAKNGEVSPASAILFKHRTIVPERLSLMITVKYQHPDKEIAALVANLIVDEYISYNEHVRVEGSLKAVEDLKDRADEQRKKVERMAVNLQDYRQKNNLVSLDQRKDINTEKLKALSVYVTESSNRLADAEVRWKQVQDRREKNQDLTELPFIANQSPTNGQSLIVLLTQQIAAQKVAIAQMHERYRDKHPQMIQAVNSLAQMQRELAKAVDAAAAAVEADYQTALRNTNEARQALAAQEDASLKLDRYAVDYLNLSRDYEVNTKLLDQILARMGETSVSGTIETQNARVVDRATPAGAPIFPNIPLNLGMGFVGGIFLGVAFAFFVSFIDDRVKSAFDIEGVVGLPLLGVIPQIKGSDPALRALVLANDSDRLAAEAFRSLCTGLRLKDVSKAAQCLLVTSTLPGEGKSFTVSNLALAFAGHSERTLIIDCDLRRPSIHRSFGLQNKKGVIDLLADKITIDDAIVKNVYPFLDVLPAGGRAHNPAQILSDRALEKLVATLRTRYDRIIFDTPPLAAVSDALMLLPLVNGCIYTVSFGKVRRKAAMFCVRKLQETTVPCIGAVLNNLNIAVSGYYYSQYYDRSYKDYYITKAQADEPEEEDAQKSEKSVKRESEPTGKRKA